MRDSGLMRLLNEQREILEEAPEGLTAKRLGYLAGCSDRQARRWINGEQPISVAFARRLLSSEDMAAAELAADLLLEGSPFVAERMDGAGADVDQDGDIDQADLLADLADGLRMAAEALCKASGPGGRRRQLRQAIIEARRRLRRGLWICRRLGWR